MVKRVDAEQKAKNRNAELLDAVEKDLDQQILSRWQGIDSEIVCQFRAGGRSEFFENFAKKYAREGGYHLTYKRGNRFNAQDTIVLRHPESEAVKRIEDAELMAGTP